MFLLYGKLRERAVCGEFCVMIGYPSGQDRLILPARDCPFRSRKQNFAKVQAGARKFLSPKLFSEIFCDFSVLIELEKASTRKKTMKTKMLMSFKNTL